MGTNLLSLSKTSSEILTLKWVVNKKNTDGPKPSTSSLRTKSTRDSETPRSDSVLLLLISKTPSTQRELDSRNSSDWTNSSLPILKPPSTKPPEKELKLKLPMSNSS